MSGYSARSAWAMADPRSETDLIRRFYRTELLADDVGISFWRSCGGVSGLHAHSGCGAEPMAQSLTPVQRLCVLLLAPMNAERSSVRTTGAFRAYGRYMATWQWSWGLRVVGLLVGLECSSVWLDLCKASFCASPYPSSVSGNATYRSVRSEGIEPWICWPVATVDLLLTFRQRLNLALRL